MFLELFKFSTRKKDPETRYGIAPILWGGFLCSILLHFATSWSSLNAGEMHFTGAPPWLFPVLVVDAFFTIGCQVYFRTLISDQSLFPQIADEKSRFYRGRRNQALLSLPIEIRGRQAIYERWFQFFFIQWCLGLSIAIYGLVIFLLKGKIAYLFGFGLIGIIDLLFFYPRKGPILDQIERWNRYRATHIT